MSRKVKVKAFPYSIPIVGPGADPGVPAASPQVTVSHPPGGRLPLLSARPAVISPAAEHHRPLAGTKLGVNNLPKVVITVSAYLQFHEGTTTTRVQKFTCRR